MKKKIITTITIIAFCFFAKAQVSQNKGIGPGTTDKKKNELFIALKAAKTDSAKADISIELFQYHWKNGRDKDSIFFYAEQAKKLSKQAGYTDGFNEACMMLCKNYANNYQVSNALKILPQVTKDQQARLKLVIGEHYLFLPEVKKADLDSAYYYFSDALNISRNINSQRWRHESLIALGKYYFAEENFIAAKKSFMEVIGDFQKNGDRSAEAHIWSEYGGYMPLNDSTFKNMIQAQETALKIYQELKDTANEMYTLEDMGLNYLLNSNFDTAKTIYLRTIELRRQLKKKKLYNSQIYLAWISLATGKFNEALSWALDADKNAHLVEAQDDYWKTNLLIGYVYGENGDRQKSLQYLLDPIMDDANNYYIYISCSKVVEQYLFLNQPQKALSHLHAIEKKNPPESMTDKEILAALYGDVYSALDKPVMAEKYYLQMIRLDVEGQKIKGSTLFTQFLNLSGSEAYYKIANFYSSQQKHATAAPYLDRALQIHSFSGYNYYSANLMKKIWWTKFKVDSAAGNYLAAIGDYEKFTNLKDSIFNVSKSNEFQRLQVQFDTEKKENDIKSRDQQISTLTQNDLLRQANLKQAHTIRNIMIAGLIVLGIFGFVVYRQYSQKNHAAKMLQHALTEKEWLLKEVHHRVKNNLHTIICLLESQAAYLDNDALQANEVSQQRIYAMSLIHQKIYQSEDIKTINMQEYLPELIRYLDDSFGNSQQIRFEVNIDPVQLDITQAIPVALIINEAVANSIKYAFPENGKGTIEILLERSGDHVLLTISDDGIGIDEAAINHELESLGIQLIRGLSKEIKGDLKIQNDHGTRVSVAFRLNPLDRGMKLPEPASIQQV